MPTLDDPEIDAAWPIPPGLRAAIRRELQPGEKIAWVGRPIAGRMARAASHRFIGGGILFSAVGGRAIYGAIGTVRFDIIFFGFCLSVLGLWAASEPIRAWSRARESGYVLTNLRAIVFRSADCLGNSIVVDSFWPGRLWGTTRAERPDGSGDLVFRQVANDDQAPGGMIEGGGFLAIAGVAEVERLVRQSLAIGREGDRCGG